MSEDRPQVKVSNSDGICTVEFTVRNILEQLSINQIEEQLAALAEQHKPINLLLNFTNVEHLSSAALGMLITLHKRIAGDHGQLKLSDIKPPIFEVFKITRLNKVFDIHDTAAKAKASFAS